MSAYPPEILWFNRWKGVIGDGLFYNIIFLCILGIFISPGYQVKFDSGWNAGIIGFSYITSFFIIGFMLICILYRIRQEQEYHESTRLAIKEREENDKLKKQKNQYPIHIYFHNHSPPGFYDQCEHPVYRE